MTVPFTLPNCILEAAKLLFPTLNFSRIHFYYDEHATEPHTYTYLTRTEITFYPHSIVLYDQFGRETFKSVCHELVHALQGRSLLRRMVHLAAQIPCKFLHGSGHADTKNCIEREAWDYEKDLDAWFLLHNVDPCIRAKGNLAVLGQLAVLNPDFAAAVAGDPSIVKSTAGCAPWDCFGKGPLNAISGVALTAIGFAVGIPGAFRESLAAQAIGGIAGAMGGIAGVIVGAASTGAVIGFVPIILFVIWGLAATLVGAIVGTLIADIVVWIGRLFGSSGGGLNLMFSQDDGMTFGSKVTFDRSQEPMSISFGEKMVPIRGTSDGSLDWSEGSEVVDRLAVSWTGLDNQVNLLGLVASPNKATRTAFEKSEDCGPGVIHEGVRIIVAWQGTENSLNTITTTDGENFALKETLKIKTPSEASPGLGGDGTIVLASIDEDLTIRLRVQSNSSGHFWRASVPLGEKADSASTVAITNAIRPDGAGNNREDFVIAWLSAAKSHSLNVMQLKINPLTGAVATGFKSTLNEKSFAGPALAYCDPFLLLAWTGTDGQVNLMRSPDLGQTWQGKQTFEHSPKDCGPALTVRPAQVAREGDHDVRIPAVVCIGWTGTG